MKRILCICLSMILILSAFSLSASALEDLTSVYGEESTSDYSEPATDIGEPDEDDENAIRTGDVDGDGKVSATDARITLRLSAKIASAGTVGVTLYADANGDGKITAADARLILRYCAKLENLTALSPVKALEGKDELGKWVCFYNTQINRLEKIHYCKRFGVYLVYINDNYLARAIASDINSDENGTFYMTDGGTKRYFKLEEADDGTSEIWFYDEEDSVSCAAGSPTYMTMDRDEFLSYLVTESTVTVSSDSSSCTNAFMSWSTDWSSSNAESGFMSVGDKKEFNANVIFRGIKGEWTSSDNSIASVSSDGVVTAEKAGFAVIKYTAGDYELAYGATVVTDIQKKIIALSKKYPAGYYYNNNEKSSKYPYVSEIPCDHSLPTYPASCKGQCAGFAAMMSNEVYGSDKKYNFFSDKSKIEVGDYLRVLPHHSVFVIAKIKKGEVTGYSPYSGYITADDDMIVVAECNWDRQCGIDWGRTMYVSDISITGDSYKR